MVTIEISKSAQPRDSSIPGYVDPGRVYLSTSASGDVVDLWTELTVSGNQKWSLHGPGMRPHDYDTDSQFTQIKSAGHPNVGCDGAAAWPSSLACSNYLTMDPEKAEVHLAAQKRPTEWDEKRIGCEERIGCVNEEAFTPSITGIELDWAILPTGKNDDDGEPLWWIRTKRHSRCIRKIGEGRDARLEWKARCNFYQEGRVWLSSTSNGDNVDLWSDNEKDNNRMWRITCLEDDA